MTKVLAGARVVVPGSVIERGWVAVEDGVITGVGNGEPPSAVSTDAVDLDGQTILPGFIDVHVHGGGGHSFTDGDPTAALGAIAFHQRHGTTTMALSLVTVPVDVMAGAVARLADVVEAGRRPDGSPGTAAGIHLEGPFLSEACCGAQDPRWMVPPTPTAVERLVAAGGGTVKIITMAPELPGALEAIERLSAAGIVVALGHTAASYDEARAGFDAGAVLATHLFNGMAPFHHREPGAVGAALVDDRVTCELILDGHHLHPAAASLAIAAKTHSRVALITDAISAAGTSDGRVSLGGRSVVVRDGAARLESTGALAGSTLTMDRAVRAALDLGVPLEAVSEMASLVPARLLGLEHNLGSIEVGKHADLVIMSPAGGVVDVLVGGRRIG